MNLPPTPEETDREVARIIADFDAHWERAMSKTKAPKFAEPPNYRMREKPRATVTAECVECGARREIEAGEVAANDMPVCHLCYGPMIAKLATLRVPKGYKP